jgi:nicotianamine synthase
MTKLSEGVQEIRSNLVKLCGTAEGDLGSHFSNLIGSHENPLDLIYQALPLLFQSSQTQPTRIFHAYPKLPPGSKTYSLCGFWSSSRNFNNLATNHLRTSYIHSYDTDPSENPKALSWFHQIQNCPDKWLSTLKIP